MRRFKSGWVLVAAAVLAICLAITKFSLDVPLRKDDQKGRNVEAERLPKRACPSKRSFPVPTNPKQPRSWRNSPGDSAIRSEQPKRKIRRGSNSRSGSRPTDPGWRPASNASDGARERRRPVCCFMVTSGEP